MKKQQRKYLLGDLIVLLYEEASKLSEKPREQKAIVHAALIDLFATRVRINRQDAKAAKTCI